MLKVNVIGSVKTCHFFFFFQKLTFLYILEEKYVLKQVTFVFTDMACSVGKIRPFIT